MGFSARIIGGRVLLGVFGVVLSLLLAEGALRVGSRFVGRESVRTLAHSGKVRVLCLGDSNTYGLYLDPPQAYPAVLERLWNQRHGNAGDQIQVFNLGYPGTNSSQLARDFQNMLWTFTPDVVTVLVGANDLWTMPADTGESQRADDRLVAALWKSSRVFQFFYLAWRELEVRRLEVTRGPRGTEHGAGKARFGDKEFALGWEATPEGGLPGRPHATELRKHLAILQRQASEFGARLVLLTYPADARFYSWANSVTRDFATTAGIPLIDLAIDFRPSCPVPPGTTVFDGPGATCPELFPDQHPTALGHERAAKILVEQLRPAVHGVRPGGSHVTSRVVAP